MRHRRAHHSEKLAPHKILATRLVNNAIYASLFGCSLQIARAERATARPSSTPYINASRCTRGELVVGAAPRYHRLMSKYETTKFNATSVKDIIE